MSAYDSKQSCTVGLWVAFQNKMCGCKNNGMMVQLRHLCVARSYIMAANCQNHSLRLSQAPTLALRISIWDLLGHDTPTGASSAATRRVHYLSCRLSAHSLARFVPPPSNLIQSMTFPHCWWRLLSRRPPAHPFISISLSGDFVYFFIYFIIGRLLLRAGGQS